MVLCLPLGMAPCLSCPVYFFRLPGGFEHLPTLVGPRSLKPAFAILCSVTSNPNSTKAPSGSDFFTCLSHSFLICEMETLTTSSSQVS